MAKTKAQPTKRPTTAAPAPGAQQTLAQRGRSAVKSSRAVAAAATPARAAKGANTSGQQRGGGGGTAAAAAGGRQRGRGQGGRAHRARSGQAALREIRRLQRSTDLLIPRAPFLRLIREIMMDVVSDPVNYRITEAAVEAIREATESVIVSLMEDAYLLALHAKRVTLFNTDIQLLIRLRNDPFFR